MTTRINGADDAFIAGRVAALERLPAWWRGAASTRRQFAEESLAAGQPRVADEHMQIASTYEARAASCEGSP